MTPEELTLRRLLWMRHGCPFSALYGDDGEMQCGACHTDFLRQPPAEIEEQWQRAGLDALRRVVEEEPLARYDEEV